MRRPSQVRADREELLPASQLPHLLDRVLKLGPYAVCRVRRSDQSTRRSSTLIRASSEHSGSAATTDRGPLPRQRCGLVHGSHTGTFQALERVADLYSIPFVDNSDDARCSPRSSSPARPALRSVLVGRGARAHAERARRGPRDLLGGASPAPSNYVERSKCIAAGRACAANPPCRRRRFEQHLEQVADLSLLDEGMTQGKLRYGLVTISSALACHRPLGAPRLHSSSAPQAPSMTESGS
jgi:hypothetical protein